MALGIFLVILLLMAAVDIKKLHFSEKGIFCEKERREDMLQRSKEQEANLRLLQRLKKEETSLRLQYLRLKKEIADLEAKQEALTRPTLALQRKTQEIRQCIRRALLLAAITLLSLWG